MTHPKSKPLEYLPVITQSHALAEMNWLSYAMAIKAYEKKPEHETRREELRRRARREILKILRLDGAS